MGLNFQHHKMQISTKWSKLGGVGTTGGELLRGKKIQKNTKYKIFKIATSREFANKHCEKKIVTNYCFGWDLWQFYRLGCHKRDDFAVYCKVIISDTYEMCVNNFRWLSSL